MLNTLQKQLSQGYRLTPDDALKLLQTADIFQLGALAEEAALRQNSRNVYFSINRHINYTNLCRIGCKFCHFSTSPTESNGYLLEPAEVASRAKQAVEANATEIHIVGGIHPDLSYDYYLSIIQQVRESCPSLHIKAFTAAEISDLAKKSSLSIEQVLTQLKQLGLNTLPGGGAEILSNQYFKQFCPKKTTPKQWLNVHRAAHELGVFTNATMLFGYRETLHQRVEHLFQLRDLQDQSISSNQAHFQCFVPLPYVPPAATPSSSHPNSALNAVDELRTIAVSRLVLDNFPHIKAFWPMLGIKLAQLALCFGCDDIDGTVTEYNVVKQNEQPITGLSTQKLCSLIREADRTPILRNGFYQPIKTQ